MRVSWSSNNVSLFEGNGAPQEADGTVRKPFVRSCGQMRADAAVRHQLRCRQHVLTLWRSVAMSLGPRTPYRDRRQLVRRTFACARLLSDLPSPSRKRPKSQMSTHGSCTSRPRALHDARSRLKICCARSRTVREYDHRAGRRRQSATKPVIQRDVGCRVSESLIG